MVRVEHAQPQSRKVGEDPIAYFLSELSSKQIKYTVELKKWKV